jgi:hypothetical protein
MKAFIALYFIQLLLFLILPKPALTFFLDDLEVSGFVKSLNVYGQASPEGLLPHYKISSNRLRLDTLWAGPRHFSFESSVEQQFLWSDPADFAPLSPGDFNRRLDLDKTWRHSDHWQSRLQMDRLNFAWQNNRTDSVIGRQAIGYGRILIFSPLDVIAPFAPDAIDTDVRTGVDAIRSTMHYGLDGQIGAVMVWGEESRYNSYLATWSDNYSEIDFLAIGGILRDRTMFGIGLAGNLGQLGIKGEVTYYNSHNKSKPDGDLHNDFAIGALETWYRFDNGLTLVMEYLYNGPGANKAKNYDAALNSAALQEGLTYLLGQHYLMITPSYEFHPLTNLQGILIWNLKDDSALIRPSVDFDLAENLSLELFWTWHVGEKPKISADTLSIVPSSEFGLRGDYGGFFLKLYF